MRLCVVLAALLVAVFAAPAQAASRDVTVDNNNLSFSPAKVRAGVGDVVTWHKSGGFHNVSSTTGMFRSGAATSAAFDYSRTFSAGSFPYVCEIHPDSMKGTIRVRPSIAPQPSGRAFTVTWAGDETNTGSRFRVQYRVADGPWKTWLARTAAHSAVFGLDDEPTGASTGKAYRFRVKSRSGTNASRYSPADSFTP